MRWLVLFFFILALSLTGGYFFATGFPFRIYSQWINGTHFNRYYSIADYRPLLLNSSPVDQIPPYQEDYGQLWKPFPIRNALMPLPTRHPLYQTIPLIEEANGKDPVIGMIFVAPDKREISRIITMPNARIPDYSRGQEFFKLPFVKNRLAKFTPDVIWKNIFTHSVVVQNKNLEEMISDLYVVFLRSKFLPKETLKYSLLKDGKAIIELRSKNKDFIVELVMGHENGNIYSYILRTAKHNDESKKLRSKFLESINFQSVDSDLGRILYTEFKQLSFARQVDQEGLLYLFSAWTQDIEKVDLLKDMIFYLERGQPSSPQLKALYVYAFKKYGKVFTTRNIFTDIGDENIQLQRKIELEAIEKRQKAQAPVQVAPPAPELSPQEKIDEGLRRAGELGSEDSSDMTVY